MVSGSAADDLAQQQTLNGETPVSIATEHTVGTNGGPDTETQLDVQMMAQVAENVDLWYWISFRSTSLTNLPFSYYNRYNFNIFHKNSRAANQRRRYWHLHLEEQNVAYLPPLGAPCSQPNRAHTRLISSLLQSVHVTHLSL